MRIGPQDTLKDHGYGLVYHAMCLYTVHYLYITLFTVNGRKNNNNKIEYKKNYVTVQTVIVIYNS